MYKSLVFAAVALVLSACAYNPTDYEELHAYESIQHAKTMN
ncbi:hypothetical protein [Acinetobacter shaoyimingii]|nr:hypothetical protein [Acinetobacter shaoyimingii]